MQSPTLEGDPITEYYRVTPTGATEIYVDATEDEFGDQKWSFGQCAQPTTVRFPLSGSERHSDVQPSYCSSAP